MKGSVTRPSNVKPEDRVAILDALEAMGWPRGEVEKSIQIESGWRTDARNPKSTASGLIQMMAATLSTLGFGIGLTPREKADAFARTSAREQLPFIKRYFERFKWRQPGDTYLAIAAPAFLGRSNDAVVYPVNSTPWLVNEPWRSALNGPVTAGSIRARVL